MRMPTLAAALNLGAAASLLLAAVIHGSLPVQAQGGVGPDITALTERVRKLEARIAEDDASPAGGGTGKAAATRLRTPFVVVDSKGREVLVVEEAGDTHVLRMGVLGTGSVIHMQTGPDNARMTLQRNGPGLEARLDVSESKGARIQAFEGSHSSMLGTGPENKHGFFVRQGESTAQATPKVLGELAATVGESGGVLRLFDKQGLQVVGAGSNPKEGGRGQVGIGPPGKAIAVMLTHTPDGAGEVQVYGDNNSKPILEMSGSKRHFLVANRSGNPAAVVGLNQNGAGTGGNFTAIDASGNNVVKVGARADSGGALCAIHYKRGLECFPQ